MKIRITFRDLIKMLLGGRVLIKSDIWNMVVEIKKGKANYITK